jgi:hypothetical protein
MLAFAEAYIRTIEHGMARGLHCAMDTFFDYYQTIAILLNAEKYNP